MILSVDGVEVGAQSVETVTEFRQESVTGGDRSLPLGHLFFAQFCRA